MNQQITVYPLCHNLISSDRITYKTIFGYINQLIVSASNMGSLWRELQIHSKPSTFWLWEKNKNKNSKIEPTEKINNKEKALHYITIVGGRHNIFKLLSIKYINSHKVALGMSMLASLWSGNFNNLFRVKGKRWKLEYLWLSGNCKTVLLETI